ncbi:MAG TPA: hydantoinase/oxoprolinase family protein [Dehalococcoidia bacterium]|nr:hydantoinase/oxoprolinase family protein [Dehalococcoidia bacterium]
MSRYLLACDAGGTMTDVIVVDEQGRFAIGKAPTTRYDESVGYMESLEEALTYWQLSMERNGREICENSETAIYTGTSMLNSLINMDGQRTGLITTRGFEDMTIQGRGSQTWIGYEWSEILHMQYRKHREPLVKRRHCRGVTERVDLFGAPVIPMYEHEARQAVKELLSEDVEAIAIVFLNSFANPSHERRAGEIAREEMKAAGRDLPLLLSSEIAPIVREVSRANATIIQAYAAEPARKQLFGVEEKLADYGYPRSLKTVLCYGGVTNIRYNRLFETMMSGPVGGMMGAMYWGSHVGVDNIVCSDVGGTSFDAGAITAGILPINREPALMQMYVNVPMIDIQSIGAGAGTYIRLDPDTSRIKLGPDSAGGTPGPVFQETGNEIPTIGDCNMILGILNPEYYLGGRVPVNKQKSLDVFQEKISDPLGLDVYTAADQCLNLINVVMREHLVRTLMLGHDIRDYVLLGYGGAGPVHLCGYAADDPWKAVATVPHAAAFSAWGGACMDYAHRRHKSVSAFVPFGADEGTKMYAAGTMNAAWEELEGQLVEELLAEGFTRDQITLEPIAYVRYYGQLYDIEVVAPGHRLNTGEDVDALMARFEDTFTKMYTLVARPPQASYLINEVAYVARVATLKPTLQRFDLEDRQPRKQAYKGSRPIFEKGQWIDAALYEMSELRAGNEISGLAVIEAPSTTLFVPSNWRARFDESETIWLERQGG